MTRTVIGWPAYKTAKANPYQALLYKAVASSEVEVVECTFRALLSAQRGSVLHLHWPDAFIANAALPAAILRLFALRCLALWCALRGVAWVWTAHNLNRPMQRHAEWMAVLFWPWFLSRISGIIYLSAASQQAAEATYPRLRSIPHVCTPHGAYEVPDTRNARTNRTEILFFGGVSRYKRVGDLIRAFGELDDADLHLRIAGAVSRQDPDPDVDAALAALPEPMLANLTLEDRFLSEEALAHRVRAARLVVLPLVGVQNSGTALYALSCHRPVLVPRLLVFEELSTQVGAGWVYFFDNQVTASDLARTLADVDDRRFGAPDLSAFDWSGIAAQTRALFEKAASE